MRDIYQVAMSVAGQETPAGSARVGPRKRFSLLCSLRGYPRAVLPLGP